MGRARRRRARRRAGGRRLPLRGGRARAPAAAAGRRRSALALAPFGPRVGAPRRGVDGGRAARRGARGGDGAVRGQPVHGRRRCCAAWSRPARCATRSPAGGWCRSASRRRSPRAGRRPSWPGGSSCCRRRRSSCWRWGRCSARSSTSSWRPAWPSSRPAWRCPRSRRRAGGTSCGRAATVARARSCTTSCARRCWSAWRPSTGAGCTRLAAERIEEPAEPRRVRARLPLRRRGRARARAARTRCAAALEAAPPPRPGRGRGAVPDRRARHARRADREQRGAIAEGLGDVLMLRGRYDEAERYLTTASELAETDARAGADRGQAGRARRSSAATWPAPCRRSSGRCGCSASGCRGRGPAISWPRPPEVVVQALHTLLPRAVRRPPHARRRTSGSCSRPRLYSRLAHAYWFARGRVPDALGPPARDEPGRALPAHGRAGPGLLRARAGDDDGPLVRARDSLRRALAGDPALAGRRLGPGPVAALLRRRALRRVREYERCIERCRRRCGCSSAPATAGRSTPPAGTSPSPSTGWAARGGGRDRALGARATACGSATRRRRASAWAPGRRRPAAACPQDVLEAELARRDRRRPHPRRGASGRGGAAAGRGHGRRRRSTALEEADGPGAPAGGCARSTWRRSAPGWPPPCARRPSAPPRPPSRARRALLQRARRTARRRARAGALVPQQPPARAARAGAGRRRGAGTAAAPGGASPQPRGRRGAGRALRVRADAAGARARGPGPGLGGRRRGPRRPRSATSARCAATRRAPRAQAAGVVAPQSSAG